MIDLQKTQVLVRWLRKGSKRPFAAINTWMAVINNLDIGTGNIFLSRDEIAEEVGITPREVSEIMTEMEDYGAISKRREGRRVHYRLNEPYYTAPLRQAEMEALPNPDGNQSATIWQIPEGSATHENTSPSAAEAFHLKLTWHLLNRWEDWRDRFRGKRKKDS